MPTKNAPISTDTAPSPVAATAPPLERAIASGRPIITTEHERSLRDELEHLRHRLEVEFTERLREARLYGAPDVNDDYLQIKEEEAVLVAGIVRITMLLEAAIVVDSADVDDDVITLGSEVEVHDRTRRRRHTLRLVGGFEPLTDGVASAGSPVGQALMGRRAGDVVEVVLPNGRKRRLEIISVEPAAPSA
jgi:transcription elongation factor GreA